MGAGRMIVGALEDALDVPTVIASAPPLDVAAQVASATSVATTALAATVGEANATALSPLVQSVVSQTLRQQQTTRAAAASNWIPGWLILAVGGYLGVVVRGH